MITQKSIGRDNAIALHETKWWDDMSVDDAVLFQLLTKELSMPFDIFHGMVEAALGESVFTHEFVDLDGLYERLRKVRSPSEMPTWDDIAEKLPAEKRLFVLEAD